MIRGAGGSSTTGAFGASWSAWYLLLLLTAIYSFNWIDRYVLVILLEPIKQELGLSDASLGFLSGFAFAAVYAVAGIPIASLADRRSRKGVIGVSVLVWSGMTLLCGMASNYWQLLLARLGVAVGESGCSPSAHSMIADAFPEQRRATAYSIYGLGVIAGLSLGLLLGGWANDRYGWRVALMLAAIPGPLFALLIFFTVREPLRQRAAAITAGDKADEAEQNSSENVSLKEGLRSLIRHPAFLFYGAGLGLANFSGYAYDTWTPAYLMRVHGMDSTEVGLIAGTLLAVSGVTGTLLGGVLADKLSRRSILWYLWLPCLSVIAMIVFVIIFMLAGDNWVLKFSYFVASLAVSMQLAPVIAITQRIMPSGLRALSSAVLLLLANLVGNGAGAWCAGLISDALTPTYGEDALRYAVILTQAVALIGVVLMWLGARRIRLQ